MTPPFSVCDPIFEYFPNCLEFLVGDPKISMPSAKCCEHMMLLNTLANYGVGPKAICWCIEIMVKGMQPPLVPSRIQDLPRMCYITLSFPISDSMDCSKWASSNQNYSIFVFSVESYYYVVSIEEGSVLLCCSIHWWVDIPFLAGWVRICHVLQ